MEKGHISKKGNNASLSNRIEVVSLNDFKSQADLLQFVAKHLAYQYKKSLKYLVDKNPEEYGKKIDAIPKLEAALEKLLKLRLKIFKKVKIINKSLILKIALKKAKIKDYKTKMFPDNITYTVNRLEFHMFKG